MSSPQPGRIIAEAMMHDHERYDQYVEWSGPVLQKYKARLLAPARLS